MKIGDKVTIERLSSGLYKTTGPMWPTGKEINLVGGAASTAIGIMQMVFKAEASDAKEPYTQREDNF